MNEFDRYDFAVTLIIDVIALGALVLYPHFWILLSICPVAFVIVVIRHLDIDELFPDEGNRPPRVIVLIRVIDGIRDWGAHLMPSWIKQHRSDPR
jgi:hypothetical protein